MGDAERQIDGTQGSIEETAPAWPAIVGGPEPPTNDLVGQHGDTAHGRYLGWLIDPDSVTPLD